MIDKQTRIKIAIQKSGRLTEHSLDLLERGGGIGAAGYDGFLMAFAQIDNMLEGVFLHDHAGGVKLAQVREGYAADLLLLDRNPLNGSDQLHASIAGVVFNGRYLTRDELQQRLAEQTRNFR